MSERDRDEVKSDIEHWVSIFDDENATPDDQECAQRQLTMLEDEYWEDYKYQ